jgi:MoxR-like ATPase
VKLANATRDVSSVGLGELARYVTFGASPRASINLILAGRALALVRGREYALPQDLREIAPDVLRHRFVLSYEALADGVTADDIIDRILAAVPMPELALRERMAGSAVPVAGDTWTPPAQP